jgi:dTDP-L-rhamnose 4-epimerase
MVGPGKMSGFFLPNLFQSCIDNKPIPLTHCEQTRDFISVYNVCEMIGRIIENPDKAKGQVFNLGSGKPTTLRYFAELVQNILGGGILQFGALQYRKNEAMNFYASMETFVSTFGSIKQISLEEMIQSCVPTLEK